jgi:hypothetical protein
MLVLILLCVSGAAFMVAVLAIVVSRIGEVRRGLTVEDESPRGFPIEPLSRRDE